jgi:hypothetical protein
MKNKAAATTKQLTPEEEKLAMMLMTENVCSIPNKDDLMKQFNELVKPETPKQ